MAWATEGWRPRSARGCTSPVNSLFVSLSVVAGLALPVIVRDGTRPLPTEVMCNPSSAVVPLNAAVAERRQIDRNHSSQRAPLYHRQGLHLRALGLLALD